MPVDDIMRDQTEAIWREFSDQLKQFVRRRIVDTSLEDDILQDVFLKIHSRIATLKDSTKIRGWLYQIARNTIIDYYRNKTIKTAISEPSLAFDELPQNEVFQDVASGLKTMIEELPEKYAQALLLTEFQGLTQKELAQRLGISVSSAKSRVQRARKMLKDSLMRCCHFEFDRYGTIIDSHPITCCCCTTSHENHIA